MKKYDLILIGLYMLFLLVFGGVLYSFGQYQRNEMEKASEICDKIRRMEVKAVVLNDSLLEFHIDREKGTFGIQNGCVRNLEGFRLKNDTLYIESVAGKRGNYLFLNVPEGIPVTASPGSRVYYKD